MDLHPGDRVVIRAFDDIPEHLFLVDEVYDGCVGDCSLSGPLECEYGEPDFHMILRKITSRIFQTERNLRDVSADPLRLSERSDLALSPQLPQGWC